MRKLVFLALVLLLLAPLSFAKRPRHHSRHAWHSDSSRGRSSRYHRSAALPPGQAKKLERGRRLGPGQERKLYGDLPPGQAKKMNGGLPPGQAKKR